MPFPALNDTGFLSVEDSKAFKDNRIANSIRHESQGGLMITRKRFTGNLGRKIETGFSFITQTDKALLDAYFVKVSGTDIKFIYIHPITGESLTVLFESVWQPVYVGLGINLRWDINAIKLFTV